MCGKESMSSVTGGSYWPSFMAWARRAAESKNTASSSARWLGAASTPSSREKVDCEVSRPSPSSGERRACWMRQGARLDRNAARRWLSPSSASRPSCRSMSATCSPGCARCARGSWIAELRGEGAGDAEALVELAQQRHASKAGQALWTALDAQRTARNRGGARYGGSHPSDVGVGLRAAGLNNCQYELRHSVGA